VSATDIGAERSARAQASGERGARARVSAVFELRGSGRDGVARSAAELVHALQQFAATPGRECDLDVSLDMQPPAGGD
jgi:hypothetical protein